MLIGWTKAPGTLRYWRLTVCQHLKYYFIFSKWPWLDEGEAHLRPRKVVTAMSFQILNCHLTFPATARI